MRDSLTRPLTRGPTRTRTRIQTRCLGISQNTKAIEHSFKTSRRCLQIRLLLSVTKVQTDRLNDVCASHVSHFGPGLVRLKLRDRPLEKLWGGGGGGIFVPPVFFFDNPPPPP